MGKVYFERKIIHFNAERGLRDLILYDLSENRDFAAPNNQSYAWDLRLGNCLKRFTRYTKTTEEKTKKIIDKHCPNTDIVDFVNMGQCGYFAVTAKPLNENKRGKKYFIATKNKNGWHEWHNKIRNITYFNKKTEAVEEAIKYALKAYHLDIVVINKKNEIVSSIYLKKKYYKTKPKLATKKNRIILPAYYYFVGLCYVG